MVNNKSLLIIQSKLAHFIFKKYDNRHTIVYFQQLISNFGEIIVSFKHDDA